MDDASGCDVVSSEGFVDLSFLRPLYAVEGPVVSVHLDTSREDQDADKRIELVWNGLRKHLEDAGVDTATLDAVAAAVGGSPEIVGPQGESLYAADGQLLAVHTLSAPPAADRAVAGPVEDVLETVLDRDRQLPYVVVALDRQGGDIDAYAVGTFDPARSRSYNGSTLHITRVKAGGPSKASYHRRTENVWDRNTAGVAEEIAQAVASVEASVVFVGGDDKATAVLRDQPVLAALDVSIVDVSGGRGGEDALASLRASVDAALAEASARAHEEAFARYTAAAGSGAGISSIPAVTEALAEGRVETLLLSADRSGEPAKWSSAAEPLRVTSAPEALGTSGAEAFSMSAAALLLRAATLSDAGFTEIPEGQSAADGCAATLRY
ncbi:Vms1/Ankzf1 family peptidyl-tRNA hydrolase [Streptomyces sp. NPDC048512]|uniref:baeRF2 domain-containing protein n=1 Tax=Streptomyces sp. NPDC048512 TaxID=3365563 RepID=UPI0037187D71